MNILLGLLFFTLSYSAFSLVDYTEGSSSELLQISGQSSTKINKPSPNTRSRSKSSGNTSGYGLKLSPYYKSVKVKSDKEGTVDFTGIKLDLHTPYNIFLRSNYARGASRSVLLAKSSSSQDGNAEAYLGFNWFTIGQGKGAAKVDILFGGRFKKDGTDFATSRNDRIVSVETTKSIEQFTLGFGADYTLTGTPEDEMEMAIGNVFAYKMAFGWVISQDIRFAVEGNIYNIAENENEDLDNKLDQSVSFSSISPGIFLDIAPNVSVQFGGSFRVRRLNTDLDISYTDARLYMFEGAYGNSIFSYLTVSI